MALNHALSVPGIRNIADAFGISGAKLGYALDTLTGNATGQLQNLYDMYAEAAIGGRNTGILKTLQAQVLGGSMPAWGAFAMPSPMTMLPVMGPFVGGGYAGGRQQIDLGFGSNIPILSKIFNPMRRAAGRFERMLRHNPAARAAFEAQIGGRITSFGFRNDGKMTIQRFAPGFSPGMMGMTNPFAMTAMNSFMGMQHAVTGAFGGLLGGLGPMFGAGSLLGSPFMGLALGGFSNVLGGMMGPVGAAGQGFSPFDNSGPRGGMGFGSWNPLAQPGRTNNTNPAYEQAHQYQTASILADPSLTVEDKVTLMLMLIMKKMDRDIERQAQYVNSIQQQQSQRSGGKGGKGSQGNSSPSIDIETMKLKRLVDKRGQMFDMLRQIIDKYNETAKNMIQSIGR
jgi:hypothetical protein